MLTVCPKCTLTLVVTSSDLRVGQGYVRCGRCTTVFNALLSLADDAADAAAASNAALPESTHEGLVESQGTETVETIVLEGDGVMQTEEFVDIGTFNREMADAARQQLAAYVPDEPTEANEPAPPELWLHDEEWSGDDAAPAIDTAPAIDAASTPATEALATAPAAAAPRYRNYLWPAVAALLLLVAGLQLLHHWRNELALNATWYRLLSGPYQSLGTPLQPLWDLRGYDLQQLGGGIDDQHHGLRIQVRIASRGNAQLPFPILRLALYNRFGKRLLTRDLMVGEYLPPALHSGQFMVRAQRYDSEFGVAEVATDVASFELDVCLPAGRGLRCANDQPLT